MKRLSELIKDARVIRFKAWIKQPSTIKGILMLASIAGIGVDPEKVQSILVGAGVVYGLISAFYDKN